MAKSLEELQLAFKAQYPQNEDKKQEAAESPKLTKKPEKPIEEPIEEPKKVIEAGKITVSAKKETSPNEEKLAERLTSQLDDIKQKDVKQKEIRQEDKKEQEKVQNRQEKIDSLVEEAKAIDKKDEEKRARASVISDILFYGALILMVVFAVLFSRGAFGNEAVGGYRFYEVLTTSMDSVYPRGSLILIKEVDAGELIVGDDITFSRDSSNLITHRIEEIYENYEDSGRRAFITKGVDNAVVDAQVVIADNVVGKVVRGFAGLGATLSWMGSNLWIILILFLSLMALSFFIRIFWREHKKGRELSS